MLKKCLIYGNCQTIVIKSFLQKNKQFTAQYYFVEMKPVHLLSEEDIPSLIKAIKDVDLFIYQPVSDNYKGNNQLSTRYLRSCLKPESHVISFPVAYFTGYNPEMVYMKGKHGEVLAEPFPYHDSNIIDFYVQGKTVNETHYYLLENDRFYSREYLEKNLDNTLKNLSQREEELDIKLSSFILSNFQAFKLFHSFNHPSCTIISYICNSILRLLKISESKDFFSTLNEPDPLKRHWFPIYPSLYRGLELKFETKQKYCFENQLFDVKEVIESYFRFYDQNSDCVQENLLRIKKTQTSESFIEKSDSAISHEELKKIDDDRVDITDRKIETYKEAEHFYENAQSLKQGGQNEDAIIAYRHAIKIDEKQPKFYLGLGEALKRTGKYKEAVNIYLDALKLFPNNFLIYHRTGEALGTNGKTEESIHYYQKALELNPRFGWSYFCLGNIYAEKGWLEQAVTFYQRACDSNPNSPHFHFHLKLGEAFQKQGELDKALDTYYLLLKCNFQNTQESLIYYKIGLILSKQKKTDEAITTLIKALQIHPNNRQVYQTLGEILWQQNHIDDSAQCFNNILPKHLLCQYNPSATTQTQVLASDATNVQIIKVYSKETVFYSPPKTLSKDLPSLFKRTQAEIPETFVALLSNGRAYLDGYNNAFMTSDDELLTDLSSGNAELITSSNKLPTAINIEGTVCSLVSPGAGGVYYHWIVDLLPRIELVRQSGISLDSIDKFLVNRCQSRFQKETLNKLGISLSKIIESESFPHIKAKQIIAPVLNNSNGITAGKWMYDFLKKEFIIKDSDRMKYNCKRIYISRIRAKYRKILNEEEVVNYLSTLGFKSIILESLSVVEQAGLMSQAEAVIAPHGAGLTNLIFCPEGTKVIELFGQHLNPSYWAISNRCGLEYLSLFCDTFETSQSLSPSPEYHKNFLERNAQDIYVNIDHLSRLIKLSRLD